MKDDKNKQGKGINKALISNVKLKGDQNMLTINKHI